MGGSTSWTETMGHLVKSMLIYNKVIIETFLAYPKSMSHIMSQRLSAAKHLITLQLLALSAEWQAEAIQAISKLSTLDSNPPKQNSR